MAVEEEGEEGVVEDGVVEDSGVEEEVEDTGGEVVEEVGTKVEEDTGEDIALDLLEDMNSEALDRNSTGVAWDTEEVWVMEDQGLGEKAMDMASIIKDPMASKEDIPITETTPFTVIPCSKIHGGFCCRSVQVTIRTKRVQQRKHHLVISKVGAVVMVMVVQWK